MEELLKIQETIDELTKERDRYKKSYFEIVTKLMDEKKRNEELTKRVEDLTEQLKEADGMDNVVENFAYFAALIRTILGAETSDLLFNAAQRMKKERAEKEQK